MKIMFVYENNSSKNECDKIIHKLLRKYKHYYKQVDYFNYENKIIVTIGV